MVFVLDLDSMLGPSDRDMSSSLLTYKLIIYFLNISKYIVDPMEQYSSGWEGHKGSSAMDY